MKETEVEQINEPGVKQKQKPGEKKSKKKKKKRYDKGNYSMNKNETKQK